MTKIWDHQNGLNTKNGLIWRIWDLGYLHFRSPF